MNRYKYTLTMNKETLEDGQYNTDVECFSFVCMDSDEDSSIILSHMLKVLPLMLEKINDYAAVKGGRINDRPKYKNNNVLPRIRISR